MTRHLPYDRSQRIADQIYRIVAEALVTEISDPRLAGVRVTKVRMTGDLRTARVNFHVANAAEEQRAAAQKGFMSARGFIKRRIGEEIELKFMPEIEFYYDDSVDIEERVEDLMEGLK